MTLVGAPVGWQRSTAASSTPATRTSVVSCAVAPDQHLDPPTLPQSSRSRRAHLRRVDASDALVRYGDFDMTAGISTGAALPCFLRRCSSLALNIGPCRRPCTALLRQLLAASRSRRLPPRLRSPPHRERSSRLRSLTKCAAPTAAGDRKELRGRSL